MADNQKKFARYRWGKNRIGNYNITIPLGKKSTKFIVFTIGKPLSHFLSLIVRTNSNGFAVGCALWFLQLSFSFTDDNYAEKPSLQYGFFIKKGLTIYLPQRYVIWGRK